MVCPRIVRWLTSTKPTLSPSPFSAVQRSDCSISKGIRIFFAKSFHYILDFLWLVGQWKVEVLEEYRLFAERAAPLLRPGGKLLVEIGAGQKEHVLRVFEQSSELRHVGAHRDPADPHERVLEFRRN